MKWMVVRIPKQKRRCGVPEEKTMSNDMVFSSGAGDEARTRYLHLGKVALYRMSYARIRLNASVILPQKVNLSSVFLVFFEFQAVSGMVRACPGCQEKPCAVQAG